MFVDESLACEWNHKLDAHLSSYDNADVEYHERMHDLCSTKVSYGYGAQMSHWIDIAQTRFYEWL